MRLALRDFGALVDDLADTPSTTDRPAEEGEQADRHDDGLDVDDLAEFVNGNESATQTDQPGNREPNQSAASHADFFAERIVHFGDSHGPRQDHCVDTVATRKYCQGLFMDNGKDTYVWTICTPVQTMVMASRLKIGQ